MFIVHYLCFDKVERGKESFLMDDNDNWTCSAIEIKTNILARTDEFSGALSGHVFQWISCNQ